MANPRENIGNGQSGAAAQVSVPLIQLTLQENLAQVFGSKLEFLKPHAWREFGLTAEVKPEGALAFFSQLKTDERFQFNMLIDVTAVDWLDNRENRFDVVYQLLSLTRLHRLCVKIQIPEENPEVDSVRSLWESANFLEREVWDMYGIKFKGHGDLRRILMYDEFTGHPLRKDYPLRGKQPRVPLRVPELRNTSADMERPPLVSLPVRRGRANG